MPSRCEHRYQPWRRQRSCRALLCIGRQDGARVGSGAAWICGDVVWPSGGDHRVGRSYGAACALSRGGSNGAPVEGGRGDAAPLLKRAYGAGRRVRAAPRGELCERRPGRPAHLVVGQAEAAGMHSTECPWPGAMGRAVLALCADRAWLQRRCDQRLVRRIGTLLGGRRGRANDAAAL